MKFKSLLHDLDLLITAIAVSVLCHIVVVVALSNVESRHQVPRLGGGTVLTASLVEQAKLDALTESRLQEKSESLSKGSDESVIGNGFGETSNVRGLPWRRSSASVEASYGLMSTQGRLAQQQQENSYGAAKAKELKTLAELMRLLSGLQTQADCQVAYALDKPATVTCDSAMDAKLVLGVLGNLIQPIAVVQPITLKISPGKQIYIDGFLP